ncbi:hypothetical protein PHISP_08570, partial [Aspergillus sp. HF37]
MTDRSVDVLAERSRNVGKWCPEMRGQVIENLSEVLRQDGIHDQVGRVAFRAHQDSDVVEPFDEGPS